VLSNGGKQDLHPEFYNWFPFLTERKKDVLVSDSVLQRQGYLDLLRRLKSENKKKIVIIGGSHSGFSTAWLLLNGPADLLHNTHVTPTV
jgi:DNA-binding NtrC family response regulator